MKSADISIVIPSYNADDTLDLCLEAIQSQGEELAIETIVVDCSPHERVRNMAQARNCRYIHRDLPFTPGIGRNIGAEGALGDLLLFVDSDVLLEKSTLRSCWAAYKGGFKVFSGSLDLERQRGFGLASLIEHYFFNHEYHRSRKAKRRRNLGSPLMAVDRELFLQAGGFKDIPRMQDTEFSERLARSGVDLMFVPEVHGKQIQHSPMTVVFRKAFINGNNLFFLRYGQGAGWKKRLVLFFLLPVMGAAKTVRILARQMVYAKPLDKVIVVFVSPLLCFCGMLWTLGMYNGLVRNWGISTNR